MKHLLLIITTLCVLPIRIFAQTTNPILIADYYTKDSTFVMDGYTYQCDVSAGRLVTLYNADNRWTYAEQINTETGKIFGWTKDNPIVDDYYMEQKLFRIVNQAFPRSLAEQFGNYQLLLEICLDLETGRVNEVTFRFDTAKFYGKIPLSFYRDIELKLKEEISFQITDIGKKLNYVSLTWLQTPTGK